MVNGLTIGVASGALAVCVGAWIHAAPFATVDTMPARPGCAAQRGNDVPPRPGRHRGGRGGGPRGYPQYLNCDLYYLLSSALKVWLKETKNQWCLPSVCLISPAVGDGGSAGN